MFDDTPDHPLAKTHAITEVKCDQFVRFFYAHLFRHHPKTRPLFPILMDEQHDRFGQALKNIVRHAGDPHLRRYLETLGRDHRKFNVGCDFYQAVGETLIAALKQCCGVAWTAEAERAWTAAYASISESMMAGAAEAEQQGLPCWWDAEITESHRQSGDHVVITARLDRHLPYRAGQYITLHTARLPGVWRPYSLACPPRTDRVVELHVSRVRQGRLSGTLVGESTPGDILRLGPANGCTTLSPLLPRPLAFMAAGTGWAQIKALLQELAQRPAAPQAWAILTVQDSRRFYDLEGFKALEHSCPQMDFLLLDSRGSGGAHEATRRLQSFISGTGGWSARDVYLSGPPGFVSCARQALIDNGSVSERIFADAEPGYLSDDSRASVPPSVRRVLNRAPRWIDPANGASMCEAARPSRRHPGPGAR
ncbi:globin domain-containing protein [Streptomyces sp. PmtG]